MVQLPSLRQIATDRRLGPAALRVYVILTEELDVVDFRPVKLLYLAKVLKMDRANVGKAVRELARAGYLKKGVRDQSGVFTYRLVFSLAVGEITTPRAG